MMLKLLAILLLVLFCSPAFAEWEPWEPSSKRQQQTQRQTETDPLQQMVKTFQKYISPVDGARCRMYPTCSGYARQALHKHGTFVGMMMTVDRLYREPDPIERQEPIYKWGYKRFYDPLAENDFWWDKQENN